MNPFFIVGILNVTPDSYFDGGRWNSIESAVRRAGELLQEGADIVEVGGESTGPNSSDVGIEEELQRTIPIIQAIMSAYPRARVSIDTWKSAVAAQAMEHGAVMVNDVTAGRGDNAMFHMLANGKWQMDKQKFVLMYSKDPTPRTTINPMQYDDVVASIMGFLRKRKEAAIAEGIDPQHIILDPGLGHFISSDPKYSYEIINRLQEFQSLGCPILLSPSRKSFLAGPENRPPEDRLPATIAASAVALLKGTRYIRTHDVGAVRQGCDVALSISQRCRS